MVVCYTAEVKNKEEERMGRKLESKKRRYKSVWLYAHCLSVLEESYIYEYASINLSDTYNMMKNWKEPWDFVS